MSIGVQLVANGIVAGSAYSLLGISFGLIYSTARFFHFAYGGIYTAAAYAAYLTFVVLHLPFGLSLALAVTCAACLGVLCQTMVYQPLRRRGSGPASLLVASLGLFVVMQSVVSLGFGDATRVLRSGGLGSVAVFGALITPIQIAVIVTNLVMCAVVWLAVQFTRIGRATRAVADDVELSRIAGVNVERVIVIVFAVGSALAAVAAILASLDTDMRPTMGFEALLMGVVAAVIGGTGSIPGAFVGGMFLGLAQQIGVWRLPTAWQDAIAFCLLILCLIFRPQGVFGLPLRRTRI